jgi:hypothetical protein
MEELDAAIAALKEQLAVRDSKRLDKENADSVLVEAQSEADTAAASLTSAEQSTAHARDAAIAAITAAAQ